MIAALLLLLLQTESVTTEHFEVVSTHRDRAYVRQVAEALEAGYAAMTEALGRKPVEEARYRVNLYETLEEYKAIDRKLNEGRFEHNWAFSHPRTGESYIALQPRSGAPPLDRTLCLFRHEAFHLMTYRHAAWMIDAPEWLSEGLAERAAELATKTLGLQGDLKFSDAVTLTRAQLQAERAWSLADLMNKRGSSGADFTKRWTWYAQAWLLVKYLSEERSESWDRFVKRLESGPEARPRTNELLFEIAGETADKLEVAWIAWIRKLKPAPWRRVDGDWRRTQDGFEGASFTSYSAFLMSDSTIRKPRYTLRAEAQVRKVGAGQVDLLVTPSEEDYAVARMVKAYLVRSGAAGIMVRMKGEWKQVAWRRIEPELIAPERWVRLEMEVEGRTVRLKADGVVRVEHTFKDEAFPLDDVRWGVGNYDSHTTFRKIDIR